jgi:hypothetical protein
VIQVACRTTFIHGFDTRADLFIPCPFDFVALGRLIQIEQKAHKSETFAARKLNDFLGYFLDGRGHGDMLRGYS